MASFLQPAAEKRKILNDMEHKIKFAPVVHTIRKSQSSLLAQWVKYPALSVICLGHCCGSGLILCPGTSACLELGQKKNVSKKNPQKPQSLSVCVYTHINLYVYVYIYTHYIYTYTLIYMYIYTQIIKERNLISKAQI